MGLILTELGHGIRSRDDLGQERAWKALLLSSRMLLFHEPLCAGATRSDSMQHRFDLFKGADWQSLWATSSQVARPRPRKQRLVGGCAAEKERHAKACEKVRQAEVSHAAQLLTASPLAPGTPENLAELTNPAQRPPQLARPIPESVLNHTPAEPVVLTTPSSSKTSAGKSAVLEAALQGRKASTYKPFCRMQIFASSLPLQHATWLKAMCPQQSQQACGWDGSLHW